MFLDQFKDFMILVLIAAAVVAGVIGEPSDTIAIAVIVLLNAVLGFVQEYRAEKAMAALKKWPPLRRPSFGTGNPTRSPRTGLVPGDLVLLEAGNVVPADIRLIEAVQLRTRGGGPDRRVRARWRNIPRSLNEADLSLGDRKNMVYKGTLVTYGRGRGW